MTPLTLVLTPTLLCGLFPLAYVSLSSAFKTVKQRAYILSAISSAVMSILSLPFVWTYLSIGLAGVWEKGQTGWMRVVGEVGVVFFGCYLSADLAIGYFKYRSQIGLLTGWIHHSCYIALMVYLLNTRQAPLFLTAGIMEVPTFDLAISTLFPSVRNDARFLSKFFLLRIIFHLTLLCDLARPSSIALTDGSLVPVTMYALSALLHISWFQAGLRGHLRRRTKARGTARDTGDTMLDAAVAVDSTVYDNLIPRTPGGATPDDSPLVTPRSLVISSTGTMDSEEKGYHFPNLPHIVMPNLPLPTMASLPNLQIPSFQDLTGKLNAEQLRREFGEAVKARWETQRGRFRGRGGVGLGRLGLRRGRGWSGVGEGPDAEEEDGLRVVVREVKEE